MDGKSAFKRGPRNTLKILISALKHSAERSIVKLLQGVARDELLMRIPPRSALPTLISWESVWAGYLFDSFTAHFMQVGRWGSPIGARASRKEDTPPAYSGGGRQGCGAGSLRSSRTPSGCSCRGLVEGLLRVQARRVTRLRKQPLFCCPLTGTLPASLLGGTSHSSPVPSP